jgi:ketosteroid isomerase-like protein
VIFQRIGRSWLTFVLLAASCFAAPRTGSAQIPAGEEQRNIQVIDSFIAAWNARDAARVMAFFADDARFAVGAPGKTQFQKPEFTTFINGAKSLKMTVAPGSTWAKGPVVTHERTDDIEMANGSRQASGTYVAVFTLRDGKIVDFIDFRKP